MTLPIPDKLPLPLKVHRHQGEPCPRCGTTIEAIHYEDYVMRYCPQEQTGGGAQGPPAVAAAEVAQSALPGARRVGGHVVLLATIITAVIAQAAAPVAVTGSAGSITSGGAIVAGTVDPQGSPTTYQVEYGTSSSYGVQTAAQDAGRATTRSRSPSRLPA